MRRARRGPIAIALLAASACGSFGGVEEASDASTDAAAADGAASDAAAPDGAASDGAAPDGRKADDATAGDTTKLAWILGTTVDADEVHEGQSADQKCTAELTGSGRTGTAIAWVSHQSMSPVARLGTPTGPWRDAAGTLIFADRTAITGAGPAAPLNRMMNGTPVAGNAWTGVQQKGSVGLSCNDWSTQDSQLQGLAGTLGALGGSWTHATALPCSSAKLSIICLQR